MSLQRTTKTTGPYSYMFGQISATLIIALVMLFLSSCRTGQTTETHQDRGPEALAVQEVEQAEHMMDEEAAEDGPEVDDQSEQAMEERPEESQQESEPSIIALFAGKSLDNWQVVDFGGQGKVAVRDGAMHLEQGNDMTGVRWTGPFVRTDYEITLEAMRVNGSDFFCALTFPVDANACSLVLGGWGGSICGISNIDYYDAANNQTTAFRTFENGQWYDVRVVVRPHRIKAWVDEEELVDVVIVGRNIDTRFEVDPCKPLGLATWQTHGAARNIWMRKLPPLPKEQIEAESEDAMW